MASEDCDYLPSSYMDLSAGRYGDASSDRDWEVDSVSSDDSSSAAGTRRKRKQTSLGVRKPTGGASGGGGGSSGGPRVLHRWTAEEHARLEALVRQYGTERNWALIAEGIRGRSGKQCRERWLNHMREGIIKGNWLADEEFHLALCHMLVGNQWSLHCNRLRGRTENSIKNFWNATMRSKQPNKRRGFLWAYIDRVKVALDDEALRHQALADTVAIVYAQTNDWLPAWLQARIEAGELELPRVGEALGRGWRRLLDREHAFLRGRDTGAAAASIGGIPYPNPASSGAALQLLPAAPKPAARRQAMGQHVQHPPPLQARERREAQPLYYDPGPASPSLLQVQAPGGPALGQQLQLGPQRAPSLGLDPLGDVMMLGDAPSYPGPEAAFVAAGVATGSCACDAAARDVGAAGTAGRAPVAGGAYSAGDNSEDGDDEDELLVEELPDALMPDGGEAPSRAIVAPGLPRLVVTAPQGAWWGGDAGGVSLAAAVAAAAAGLGAPESGVAAGAVANGGASPPPLSRDSSFCGSAGSTGATPTMSRLRLASNSPAPPQPPPSVMLAGGAFGTTCAGAAVSGAGATPAPAPVGPAIGLRPYQPSHLSASASDFSSGSALMLQPAWLMGGAAAAPHPSLGWAGTNPSSAPSLCEALPALQLPLQLPPPLLQQLVDLAAPEPVGANDAARASPFSSPHAQGGEAFGARRPSIPSAAAGGPASAPPTFGGIPAAAPLLSRFAASRRRTCEGGGPSYPAGFGAPANEAPLPWEAYTAATLLQPPLRRSSANSSATMPTVIASTREPAAGGEVPRQTASHGHGGAELEAALGAVPSLDAPGSAGAAHVPCFGSVGSGSHGCAATCDGAGPIPSRMHVSGSLGFLSSASLMSALGGADSTLLLMDGQALSSLDGFPNTVDGSNGACGPTDA